MLDYIWRSVKSSCQPVFWWLQWRTASHLVVTYSCCMTAFTVLLFLFYVITAAHLCEEVITKSVSYKCWILTVNFSCEDTRFVTKSTTREITGFTPTRKTISLCSVMTFTHIRFNFISIFFNARLEMNSEYSPPLPSIAEAFRWFHYEETVAARCQASWAIWKCQPTTLILCTVHFTHDLLEQSAKPNEGLVVCSFSFVTRGVPVMHIHPQPFIVGIKWLQQTANRAFPLSPRLSYRKVCSVGLIVLIVLFTVGCYSKVSLMFGEIVPTLCGILSSSCFGTANEWIDK